MKYAEELAEHRRIAILRILTDADGRANESVLRDALERWGLSTGLTRAVVRDELRFLEKAGCIVLEWPAETLAVAQITERGEDAALGRIKIEGVRKPSITV